MNPGSLASQSASLAYATSTNSNQQKPRPYPQVVWTLAYSSPDDIHVHSKCILCGTSKSSRIHFWQTAVKAQHSIYLLGWLFAFGLVLFIYLFFQSGEKEIVCYMNLKTYSLLWKPRANWRSPCPRPHFLLPGTLLLSV